MKRAALIVLALLAPAVAQAAPDLGKLTAGWGKHSSYFLDASVGPAGQLRVRATETFLEARLPEKRQALEELAGAWRAASPADPLLLEVRWAYGGWLWRGKRDEKTGKEKVALVDRWDDGGFPWMQDASPWGKWFMFFGGQTMSGGNIGSSSGFNLRIGSTLFRDKYDVAFTFNRTSTGPTPKIELTAIGVLGRALFKIPDTDYGYNIGGQITTISGENFDTENELSVLGGLNYYMPRGTWDLSLNIGDEGTRTLVVGYSIFLNR